MRLIPQVLRHYLVMNSVHTMSIDSLMDYCSNMPLLVHCKRMLLHDKAMAYAEIERYCQQLYDKKFHFLYKSKKEMGKDWDPTQVWEEDIAGMRYDNWELIAVLRELKLWIEKQPEYRYPAEINGQIVFDIII